MPGNQQPGKLLFATLLVLTVVSGLVDAVSYLGLGHVFTANMTGNVVLLGFAAAGASGFSAPACLTSLGAFLAGAAAAGRAARWLGSRRHLLAVAMTTEAVVTGAAAIVAAVVSTASQGWPRFTIIAVLAFGMGVRNSTIRRLAVPDLTTTVLTLTLTGLAADSPLAGGDGGHSARRASAVAAMLAGALAGASAFLHAGMAVTLGIAAVAVAASGAAFWAAQESRRLDQPAS
ncbi:MAG TPA: YoaK family protein [Streptosporangiaceae bacterium]|jgi:uncharacterized membrane protein YoaK (UPF0700 family)|nr:YoaK family protein [Streptosporangiaceae bacterium]